MIKPHQFVKLAELDLADYPRTDSNDSIDVLIGSDYYWDIVSGDVIRGGGPTAVHSRLGWLLSGPIQGNTPLTTNLLLQGSHLTPTQKESDELVVNLQRFRDTESLGTTEPVTEDREFDKII